MIEQFGVKYRVDKETKEVLVRVPLLDITTTAETEEKVPEAAKAAIRLTRLFHEQSNHKLPSEHGFKSCVVEVEF